MSKIYTDITELLYDCCYGKTIVQRGYPRNFEASMVNLTGFERELKKVLKKYAVQVRSKTTDQANKPPKRKLAHIAPKAKGKVE